jgi:hypothetical protein
VNHRLHVENLVHKTLTDQQDIPTALATLNTALDYALEHFPITEITPELMDQGVYVMADTVDHFFTDNYRDLPDELYPLAIMRVLGTKITNRPAYDLSRVTGFKEFQQRYQKIVVGNLTRVNKVDLGIPIADWFDTRAHYKDKVDSAKLARKQGLTANQWYTQYCASQQALEHSVDTPASPA